jgi:hypothetical protein
MKSSSGMELRKRDAFLLGKEFEPGIDLFLGGAGQRTTRLAGRILARFF